MGIIAAHIFEDDEQQTVYLELEDIVDIELARQAVTILMGCPNEMRLIRGCFQKIEQVERQNEIVLDVQEDYDIEENNHSVPCLFERNYLFIVNGSRKTIELRKKDDGKTFKICFEIVEKRR